MYAGVGQWSENIVISPAAFARRGPPLVHLPPRRPKTQGGMTRASVPWWRLGKAFNPSMRGMGEYFAPAGMGEYFAPAGMGEYFSGMGDTAAAATTATTPATSTSPFSDPAKVKLMAIAGGAGLVVGVLATVMLKH